jgi:hypothetical protein
MKLDCSPLVPQLLIHIPIAGYFDSLLVFKGNPIQTPYPNLIQHRSLLS